MYIMRRTQLYLDDDIWKLLHIRSRQSGESISELVRQAVRDCYRAPAVERSEAMRGWVGARMGRKDLPDTETYVRRLRKRRRLRRLAG
jgi:Ribbon-helix-helix protein, copG family